MDLPPRPELFDFHGVHMTHYVTDNWENIQNFQAKPDDVFIVSYPKAGSTWLSYLMELLYFGDSSKSILERVPNLEIYISNQLLDSTPTQGILRGTVHIENLQTAPRIIKTHFPVQFMPKSVWDANCRIIYVARNAKDSAVSFFHFEHMSMISPEPGDWKSYVQRFMEGKMVFGSWNDHVKNWWKKTQSYSKLHFMFYEDMNTAREIERLHTFLGLCPSAEEKETILNLVQFDNMKKKETVNYSTLKVMDFKASSFIRKGKVGDWKNHFTVAQYEEFEEDYKKKMQDSTLQFRDKL